MLYNIGSEAYSFQALQLIPLSCWLDGSACAKANGQGVGSKIIHPSSSLGSLCDPAANRVPSAWWCSVLSTAFLLVGMHGEASWQQWEETDCSASLQGLLEGAICLLIPSCRFSPASTFCCLLPTCCLHTEQIAVSHSWKTLSFLWAFFFLIRSVQGTVKCCPGNCGIVPIYVE